MSVSVIPGDEEGCKQRIADFANYYQNSIEYDCVEKLIEETVDNTYTPEVSLSLYANRIVIPNAVPITKVYIHDVHTTGNFIFYFTLQSWIRYTIYGLS